jgi:hypothetical protein
MERRAFSVPQQLLASNEVIRISNKVSSLCIGKSIRNATQHLSKASERDTTHCSKIGYTSSKVSGKHLENLQQQITEHIIMQINSLAVSYTVQAVRRWFLAAKARVQSRVTSCENRGLENRD